MPVPPDDLLCRFIRPGDWSRRENRPRPGAFKQPALSVWHIERLRAQGAAPEDLRLEHLRGCGQAHHTAADYRILADVYRAVRPRRQVPSIRAQNFDIYGVNR